MAAFYFCTDIISSLRLFPMHCAGEKGDKGELGEKGMRGLIGFPGIKGERMAFYLSVVKKVFYI